MTPPPQSSLDQLAEELADTLRDLIAALEKPPALGDAEAHLLENLRRTLAEWEADYWLPPGSER
jgi:hypothetical protein